ncbi:MAG: hypothetical protein ACE5IY_06425 [bacterium]
MDKWIALPASGTLEGWTGAPATAAVLTALIRLEGADSLLVHRLGEYEQHHLKEGQPVMAIWREQRHGAMLDIVYFKPR